MSEAIRRPRETAGGLLVGASGRVLLGLRSHWKKVAPSLWDVIGGTIEPGETPEEALVRELTEEIGIQPTRFELVEVVPEPKPELYGEALYHLFVVTEWTGDEPRNASDEHSEIRWFTLEEVGALDNKTALPGMLILAAKALMSSGFRLDDAKSASGNGVHLRVPAPSAKIIDEGAPDASRAVAEGQKSDKNWRRPR